MQASDIGGKDFIPVVVGDLEIGIGAVLTGAVDENVDVPKSGRRGIKEGLNRFT